ncbi:MAG: hypothetical protein COB02_03110 [Candidatus Cloacimonadota bacterium]|nr:MAG: hypothetical protein COB02_03110 [Candidatus Cloacimonadota bacterium]
MKGFSLKNAYIISSQEVLNSHKCFYCQSSEIDYINFIETNCLIDKLIYKTCEIQFICNHLNIVYINLNNETLDLSYFLSNEDEKRFLKNPNSNLKECWQSDTLLFQFFLEKKDYVNAKMYSSKLIQNYPNDPYSYILDASVCLKLFDFDAYEVAYAKASNLEPILNKIELIDTVLEKKDFHLGEIFVVQNKVSRRLFINQQNQGGSLLYLDEKKGLIPSCKPESFCSLVFHPAANENLNGHLLILGLGSGAGIIALLHEFESLSIDVVEKFKEVVDLALKYFPLLNQYIDEGRLKIIVDDGLNYIQKLSDESYPKLYDALCLDMYYGEQEFSFSLDSTVLCSINCITKSIWMNYIGVYQSVDFQKLLIAFEKANILFQSVSSIVETFDQDQGPLNLLLSTKISFCQKEENFTNDLLTSLYKNVKVIESSEIEIIKEKSSQN